MPGDATRNPNTETTPYRKTHILLNNPDTVKNQGPFSECRANGAICQGGLTPDNNTNMFRLNQGGYCLLPMSVNSNYIRERTDNANSIMETSDFSLAVGSGALPGFKSPADLPGVTVDANVAATGNNYIKKSVSPSLGQTFSQVLTSDASAYPNPTLPTANVPMDRTAVSNNALPANQGFYITFITPNHKLSNQDFLLSFYYGGPVLPDGSGAYALSLSGDGTAHLSEYQNGSTFVPGTWHDREKWQYTLPQRNAGLMESVMVFPYADSISGAQFIEFRSGIVDASPSVHNIVSVAAEAVWHASGAPSSHLYTCKVTPFSPLPVGTMPPPERDAATGVGPVRVDVRRDLRMPWQVALLRFQPDGELIDLPFFVEPPINVSLPFTLSWTASLPGNSTLSGKIYDATTNTELTLVSSTPTTAVYTPNFGSNIYYVKFVFTSTSDQSQTPILNAYSVIRDGSYEVVENTPQEMAPADGGNLAQRVGRSVNISGPEGYEEAHDTAVVLITDLTNSLANVPQHAYVPIRVEVEYDPADPSLRSVLYQGYVTRAEPKRWGTNGRVYPDPNASDYECRCVGMWARLATSFPPKRQFLYPDPSTPFTAAADTVGYKVTDVVRNALGWAGFSSDMIDVPDNSIRFFPPPNGDANKMIIDPTAKIGEFVETALMDYLGWWLVLDPNAGTGNKGMWRVVAPNLAPFTNLAQFVGSPTGSGKMPNVPASYNSTNWVCPSGTIVKVPIIKGTLMGPMPKPPENNKIYLCNDGVMTQGKGGQFSIRQSMVNIKSYNCATDSTGNLQQTADPSSPDYIGFEKELIEIDHTIQGQAHADMITKRLFDFTCHGTYLVNFEAPLALVWDPNDTKQIRPRPLRYYDPVLFGSTQYLVRAVNPYYTFDGKQFARYELETPRFQ